MGLDFAIDELYASGWSDLQSQGCSRHHDGRAYPTVARAKQEFQDAGFELIIRHIQLFDCYRAEWRDTQGHSPGAVVGQSEPEAVVYALAQLRRSVALTA